MARKNDNWTGRRMRCRSYGASEHGIFVVRCMDTEGHGPGCWHEDRAGRLSVWFDPRLIEAQEGAAA